ncbi:MAG TPA: ACT domain-containing protein [Anaeromyxobacteraceae bacterium]|nr:ACT domain-containing protein [Anaeromyxobacteraceae bacterium]
MEVVQVSVFLENRSGGAADIVEVLARNAIDIQALSLADMADFGILRLIVEDADRTRRLLKEAGFTADTTRVVAVEVPDRPGGLSDTLRALREHGIGIEYMYSAARRGGAGAVVVFRFDEIGRALEALRGAGVKVLDRLDKM